MLPLSRVNVTGLLRRLQLNIQVFKIIKSPWRNHGGFAQIFSCCPKKLSRPKFGGAAAPLALPPPGPYVYGWFPSSVTQGQLNGTIECSW